jgi:uncharacterized protein YwgA
LFGRKAGGSTETIKGPQVLVAVLDLCDGIDGRKRFQKIAYLLKAEKGISVPYTFIPYLYGPYSKHLQMDLGLLSWMGLVAENYSDGSYRYLLTSKGKAVVGRAKKQLGRKMLSKLKSACKEYQVLPTDQLVSRAYAAQEIASRSL